MRGNINVRERRGYISLPIVWYMAESDWYLFDGCWRVAMGGRIIRIKQKHQQKNNLLVLWRGNPVYGISNSIPMHSFQKCRGWCNTVLRCMYRGSVVRRVVSHDSSRENWVWKRGHYTVLEFPIIEGRAIYRGIGGEGDFVDEGCLWLVVDRYNHTQMDNPIAVTADGEEEGRF
jgi:hypothetical protein